MNEHDNDELDEYTDESETEQQRRDDYDMRYREWKSDRGSYQ